MEDLNFHWTNGRNLSSITYTDDNNEVATLISFKYDDNGIRVSKTYGDTTTYYTTINGTITSQYELDENDNPINVIEFIYDSNDEIIGFTYNNNTYFYIKNIQGDITNIVDNTGNVLVNYYYDAWGVPYGENLSNDNLAEINPMRYRGYYYDCEMGLYYLQSRYYIPTFCRFLNSDLPIYAQTQKDDYAGTNLFAYCCNDAVNNSDPMGYWGADIHYGRNHKKGGPYDGTYEWLTKQDYGVCWNDSFALSVSEGNQWVDNNPNTKPMPVSKKKTKTTLGYRQGYHFNRNPFYQTDSRIEHGVYFFNEAVSKYNNAVKKYNKEISKINSTYFDRNSSNYKSAVKTQKMILYSDIKKALFILGQAMHCYQDIYAHGNITAGQLGSIFRYRILGHTLLLSKPDNPYYNWKDKKHKAVEKNKIKGVVVLSNRYYQTEGKTIELATKFKNSVKYSKYLSLNYNWN